MDEALKPADFHILLVLLDGPRHGYDIMKALERESRGKVLLEVGTLYRVLARLLDDGLLQDAGGDGRRRNYSLTRVWQRVVKAEAERLAGLVDRLRARKLLPHSEI